MTPEDIISFNGEFYEKDKMFMVKNLEDNKTYNNVDVKGLGKKPRFSNKYKKYVYKIYLDVFRDKVLNFRTIQEKDVIPNFRFKS